MKYYIGVDIGGTSVKYGVVNEKGKVIKKREASVSFDGYKTPILETVVKNLKVFLSENDYSISGIGVSAAGQIDVYEGKVIGTCGNLPNYIGSNIKERFEKEFGYTVSVMNDANCMLLAEKWIGNAKDANDVVGITLGTGVGGGILVGGHILIGSKGLAGEVGHIIIDTNGSICTCGNPGCLESVGSTKALVNLVKEKYPDIDVNGKWIFEELEKNNKLVKETVDIWIKNISLGLASLVHIFNPELILIGGGVSEQEKLLIEPLSKLVHSSIMPRFSDNLKIKKAKLGNDAGMVGAVYYYLEKYE